MPAAEPEADEARPLAVRVAGRLPDDFLLVVLRTGEALGVAGLEDAVDVAVDLAVDFFAGVFLVVAFFAGLFFAVEEDVDFFAAEAEAVDFVVGLFLAVDFVAVDFVAVDFFAGLFLAEDFVAVDFFAGLFLAVDFVAVDFVAVDFLAVVFLAVVFLAVDFLAGLFLAVVVELGDDVPPVADWGCSVTEVLLSGWSPTIQALRPRGGYDLDRSAVRRIGPQEDVRRLRPSFVGLSLLAVMLFLNLFVVDVVGGWGVVGLMVVWAVLVGLALRWFARRPGRVLLLAIGDLLLWLAAVLLAR